MILPQLEQTALSDRLNIGELLLGDALVNDLPGFQTPLPVFRCPTDIAPPMNKGRELPDANRNLQITSTSNYVGANTSHRWPHAHSEGPTTIPCWNANGAFFSGSNISFTRLTDGTSNTVLVGERAWTIGRARRSAGNVFGWAVGGTLGNGVYKDDVVGAVGTSGLNCTKNCYVGRGRSFSSMHVGGVQFVMGDGRVRFISDTIDHKKDCPLNSTLEYLIAISDGAVVGEY